jgi:low affinity Fe/Cu permease
MSSVFHIFSTAVAKAAGQPATFIAACALIAFWGLSGPLFGFSETWQLVANTMTSIVTFLMVFVLQHTQNRDQEAMQAKLDELIYAQKSADNAFIGVERLSTRQLQALREKIDTAVANRVTPSPKRRARRPIRSPEPHQE